MATCQQLQTRPARLARRFQLTQQPPQPRQPAHHARAITPTRFIKALPGTGGLKTAIARRLGCHLNTVIRLLKTEDWDEVRAAYQAEVDTVGDLAEEAIREAIKQRDDLHVATLNARWFLSRKCPQRFGAPGQLMDEAEGGPEDSPAPPAYLALEDLDLPKEVLRQILEAADRKAEKAQAVDTASDEPASPCASDNQP